MKTTRKLIALLATLTLLCTLWAPAVAAEVNPQPQTAIQASETEEIFRFGRSILAQMDNSEALLYAYDKLVYGCETLSANVDISHRTHRLNSDEAFMVWELVTNDHPEFFWLADGVSVKGYGEVITTYVLHVPSDVAKKQASLAARVTELTADLEGKSDYEKSLILHDRVATINTYKYTDNDQTVIGSLLEGASVCAGYARAYQLLLQTVGIPVFYVTGYSKGQGHAWNLVQLDGEWYYTDVTWDDQNDNGGYVYYAYFNMTYDRMCEEHVAEEFVEYLPITTATAANYHVRHDTMLELPTAEIIATLYEADLTIRLYMSGDMNAFFNELNNALYGAADRVACIGSGFSCGMTYLGREVILNLTVSRPHNYNAKNVCQKCGYKKTENHHYVVTVIDPTCVQDGKTVYTCSYCEKSYFEVIPATGKHVYESVVTAPDCVNDGFTTYTCTTCGDSYVGDETDALGHHYASVTTAPTCAEDGQTVYTCADCGDSYSEVIPATGKHVYEAVVTAPDCINGGFTTYTCTTCGDNYVGDETDALGHHYASVTTEPTCTEDGQTVYTCADCGDSYSEVIPATGEHVYDNETDADCNLCGEEREVILSGDVNGDHKLNNRDLGVLQKYLNGFSIELSPAADLNNDSKINNRDLGLLQKKLNA